ncbi:2-phosphoglycerate kinase [Raphidocelis subcapitata]|uniref:2-phosphoglycerate kinase n=1 Tax=Raphidocelis subcapitata TaxID=307507 RepID=A0A2V0NUD9_9CHLO|nr:2-phosphoglycerate kinase [Raphidocelis subcapitata]|eukprot:GBF91278.1 2-phosphoglycerate kinase [Raphidocelis subcapitata]
MEALRQQAEAPQRGPKKRTGTSKYDFVKVKVWLGDNMDHYYVLSRFLVCRMLTVTMIPVVKAVKIALELKKHFVDQNKLDAELEEELFRLMAARGFGDAYIRCHRMVAAFYRQRQPLVILICGTAWTGKSSVAQQLAARINIPNVMQTDVLHDLLRRGAAPGLARAPLWARGDLAGDAALLAEFKRECRVVRQAMQGDLVKTLSDGKPIIIEGLHLDPALFIPELARAGVIMLPARGGAPPDGGGAAQAGARGAAAARGGSAGTARAGEGGGGGGGGPPRREVRRATSAPAVRQAAQAAGGQQPAWQHPTSPQRHAAWQWDPSGQQEQAELQEEGEQRSRLGERPREQEQEQEQESVQQQLGTCELKHHTLGHQQQDQDLTEQQDEQQQGQRQQHQQQRQPDGAARLADEVGALADQLADALGPLGPRPRSGPPLTGKPPPPQQQQQQQQEQRQPLGTPPRSPLRARGALMSPGSPASPSGISREDSTTEVVSVQPSEDMALLSAEPSAGSLGRADDGAAAAAATPDAGGEEEGEEGAGRGEPPPSLRHPEVQQAQQRSRRPASATAPLPGPSGPRSVRGAGIPPAAPRPTAQTPPRGPYEPLPLTEPVPRRQPPPARAGQPPPAPPPPPAPAPASPPWPLPPLPLPPAGGGGVPLFVPVVVCMDEEDHALVAQDALACQPRGAAPDDPAAAPGGGGGGGGGPPPQLREALRRARVVQDYLTAFEGQGLPVVRLQYGADGVDRIHEYVLQCIQVAMAL